MKNILLAAVALVLAFSIFSSPVSATWCDSNYQYRKQITIDATSSSTVPTGFTLNFTTDTTGGHFLSTGNDTRIYVDNGASCAQIDRNITQQNTANTLIESGIKSAIAGGTSNTSYYIYYGNPSAGNPPNNKSKVYALQDDFNEQNHDGLWNYYTYLDGSYSTFNGELNLGINTGAGTGVMVKSTINFTENSTAEFRYRISLTATGEVFPTFGFSDRSVSRNSGTGGCIGVGESGCNSAQVFIVEGNGANYVNIYANTVNKSVEWNSVSQVDILSYYANWKVLWNKTNTTIYKNGILNQTSPWSPQGANSLPIAMGLSAASYPQVMNNTYDWVVVRKWVENPPTITLGAEESQGSAPQWSDNATKINTPQAYNNTGYTFGFQITWAKADNSTFTLGRPSGASTAYTKLTTIAVANNSGGEYWINFTQNQLGSVGTYNFSWTGWNNSGSNTTSTWNYVINKAGTTINLTINGTNGNVAYTYPTVANMTAWVANGGSGLILYRNGTNVGNQTLQLAAKVWNYTAALNHENYSAAQVERIVTMARGSSGLSISSSGGFTLSQGQSTTLTCVPVMTPTFIYDSTVITSPYTLQPALGIHIISCAISDGENYTPSSTSSALSVNSLISCTNNATFGFSKTISGLVYNWTTLNFTDVVNLGYAKTDLSDVNVSGGLAAYRNATNGYYLVVNNTWHTSITVNFGNYITNFTYNASIANVSQDNKIVNYTQTNPVSVINLLSEQDGSAFYPPNATVYLLPRCNNGENYIEVKGNTTSLILAGSSMLDRIVARVAYSADVYYSRQIYPAQINSSVVNFYLVDAFTNAVDRIDFKMLDTGYYSSKLQLYKTVQNTNLIITEGYFDASRLFSAFLTEDNEYFIRANTNGAIAEFGTIFVVVPATKELSISTITLNPSALLIGQKILMNPYWSDNYTVINIQYIDSLQQTLDLNITVLFQNGTSYASVLYHNTSSLTLTYNVSAYQGESFYVRFTFNHTTFGNSPVTYGIALFFASGFLSGFSALWLQLVSISVIILVGGVATNRTIVPGVILTVSTILTLYGIGWLVVPVVFLAFVIFFGLVSVIIYFKKGGE